MALEEAWRADAPGQTHLVFSSPGPAAAGYRTSSILIPQRSNSLRVWASPGV